MNESASARTRRPAAPATAVAFFNGQPERWEDLYRSKVAFRDRLALFTGAVASRVPVPARVLDFGCGPGTMCLALAEMGYSVLGVDPSPRMIEWARGRAASRGLSNVEFERWEADDLRLISETYDTVICSSVLEFVEDDQALLCGLCRVLRPGGHLIVSVPHAGSLFGVLEDLLKRVPCYARSRQHLMLSLRRYRKRVFLDQLGLAGFGAFDCRYFECPIPSRGGVALSRWAPLSVMMLVIARKAAVTSPP